MQNVVEIIFLYVVFFSYNNLKIGLSVVRKDPPVFNGFDYLGLRDLHFQDTGYFPVFVRTGGLLFIQFGKSSNKHRYRE